MSKLRNPLKLYDIGGKLTQSQRQNIKLIVSESFKNGKKVGFAQGCKKRRA